MLALLVIDMQVGLFTPDNPRFDADNVVSRINGLIQAVRLRGGAVIFVRHNGKPGEELEPGTPGWEFLPELEQRKTDSVVEKAACDSFCRTELEALLRGLGIDTLLITGCCTDFCVDTTLRAAVSLGFEVWAASDAHTTADRPHQDAAAVIRHHNWVWENLITPELPVRVTPAATLMKSLTEQS